MSWRLYRRFPLVPGVRLNVTTRGASVSFGHRGAWYTVGRAGRRTATLGFPGTGLRYTTTSGGGAPSALAGVVWLVIIAWVVWVLLR